MSGVQQFVNLTDKIDVELQDVLGSHLRTFLNSIIDCRQCTGKQSDIYNDLHSYKIRLIAAEKAALVSDETRPGELAEMWYGFRLDIVHYQTGCTVCEKHRDTARQVDVAAMSCARFRHEITTLVGPIRKYVEDRVQKEDYDEAMTVLDRWMPPITAEARRLLTS